jgi:ATP-binding cassette subfamily F protein uup
MLDRVSTVVLGLDGLGGAERFGDYSQWDVWQRAQQAKRARSAAAAAPRSASPPGPPDGAPPAAAKKKLSYLEAREFATLEKKIAETEQELGVLRATLEDPAIMSDAARLHVTYAKMEETRGKVDKLYARWAELEEKQG